MHKRLISILLVISVLCAGLVGRIGYITLSGVYSVADTYNSYSLTIDNLAPTLYYSNGSKLTNNRTQLVAIIRPTEKCLGELDLLFDNATKQEIIEELSKGYPVVKQIENYVTLNHIQIKETKSSYNTCSQLVSRQSSGLLSYLPQKVGELKINFSVDAIGRILSGDTGTVTNDNYNSQQGLQLTIDKEIQQITYDACENMQKGCAIVMDITNGNILSCVTKPDSSYVNKAFQQYCVGSVFKIVVACCALENKIDIQYYCNGQITVGDTTFSCQNDKAHLSQNLKQALANSCNCYFVNLALSLGSEKLLSTANLLGFDDTTTLYDDWQIKNASLPTENDLKQKGQLALLGFGQGKLTSTPLQIANCLCAIANNGKMTGVKLITSQIDDDGKVTSLYNTSANQVISSSTANTMLEYLSYVVTDGTGKKAQSNDEKSAGKTATAQTGQFTGEKEILNTWFAGVYPSDNPKYAIVILNEDGTSGSSDCCPIFSTIVEKLPK